MRLLATQLDLTVNLGNVLDAALMVVGLVMSYVKIRERLIVIETKLGPLWEEFERRRLPRDGNSR